MLRIVICCTSLLLVANGVVANEAVEPATVAKEEAAKTPVEKATDTKTEEGAKTISGMSILGNQEAPKSLVIVPWKSSRIGDMSAFARVLDDSIQPVDKEVFMRELAYYAIRSQ